MGLDQYLTGRKQFMTWGDDARMEDGVPVETVELRLGYWRKHPNLHGFIVNTFAGGVDECQEIPLDVDSLMKIAWHCRMKDLPDTDGFFFGESEMSDEEMEEDCKIIKVAIDWLEAAPKGEPGNPANEWRDVYYRASW